MAMRIIRVGEGGWVQVFPGHPDWDTTATEVGFPGVVAGGDGSGPEAPYFWNGPLGGEGSVNQFGIYAPNPNAPPQGAAPGAAPAPAPAAGADPVIPAPVLEDVPDDINPNGFQIGAGFGGKDSESVRDIQQFLIDNDYYDSPEFTNFRGDTVSQADGKWGTLTDAAYQKFLDDRNAAITRNTTATETYNAKVLAQQEAARKAKEAQRIAAEKLVSAQQLAKMFEGMFPWVTKMGTAMANKIIGWAQQGYTDEGLLAMLRTSPEWLGKFPGFYTSDGSARFENEAAYMRTVDSYRNKMIDFGFFDAATETDQGYADLMEAGIDVNELGDRMGTYRELESGSQELRDAFYVHAGLEVTVNDLFDAALDPAKKKLLVDAYNEATTSGTTDYESFIARATTAGLGRLSQSLGSLQSSGQISKADVEKVLRMDPMFAQNLMGAIWQNATTGGTVLNLEELESSFEYAVLGSAATEAGFVMPDTETLEKFIAQGIDGARLRTAYNSLGQRKSALQGMMERTSQDFSVDVGSVQSAFEGSLLGESPTLRYAQSAESALGQAGGGFAAQRAGNRLAQPGRSVR